MTRKVAVVLDAFFAQLKAEPTPILLLDYDGTLAPFRVNRFEARPYRSVLKWLTRIQEQKKTRLAIVTGRPASEIAPLLELDPPLEVWGLHGAERLNTKGRRELDRAPQAALEKLEEARRFLQLDNLGGHFEDKPNAVVMHWRGLSPAKAQTVERKARALFEPLASVKGLSLLNFESGLELRTGRDKGGAVRAILSEADTNAPAAFLGDDWTDEPGFEAVNAWSGPRLSVLVKKSSRKTIADVRIEPPVDVSTFLKRWHAALDDSGF